MMKLTYKFLLTNRNIFELIFLHEVRTNERTKGSGLSMMVVYFAPSATDTVDMNHLMERATRAMTAHQIHTTPNWLRRYT
jgi:hypothetical protein